MVFPRAHLLVSAILFLAWIGFLAYLVARTRNPVILSRPQLAVADVVLLAEVGEKDGRPNPIVTVKKVARVRANQDAPGVGTELAVEGLGDCGPRQGWNGRGSYILALSKREPGEGYEVTTIPMSPGYWPAFVTVELVNPGPDSAKLAELLTKYLGVANQKGEVAKGVLRRNVPHQEAEEIEKSLRAAKAIVRISAGESRIYEASADALEQLKEIKE